MDLCILRWIEMNVIWVWVKPWWTSLKMERRDQDSHAMHCNLMCWNLDRSSMFTLGKSFWPTFAKVSNKEGWWRMPQRNWWKPHGIQAGIPSDFKALTHATCSKLYIGGMSSLGDIPMAAQGSVSQLMGVVSLQINKTSLWVTPKSPHFHGKFHIPL